jgi:hypothetical protein
MAVELREVDLALASYPEDEWVALSATVLLVRLREKVAIDPDEVYGAVRRASYLAAAAGDAESGDDPDGPAAYAIAEELHTRERALALLDGVRGEYARAIAARLPRVEQVLRDLVAPPGEDPLRTWRQFCAALYASQMADDEAEETVEDAP